MAQSVGLFLPLPERLARQYPPGGREGEDSSPPHVTFVYIGTVEDDRVDELEQVLRRVLQAVPPLELKLLPPRTFKNDSDQTILHSQVHCPGLREAHDAVKAALERRGFTVEAYPDFKPHVTIEYIDPGEKPKFQYIAPTGRWRTDSVGFWVEERHKNLPLGYRKQVSATASSKVKDRIVEWFKENPNPSDDQVHELAESLGIDAHDFEATIYSLLTDFVNRNIVFTKVDANKRAVIACMLLAGRLELANVVAGRVEDA